MAATEALPAEPMMQQAPGMSMTEAMDVLDEFHIKRSDYDRVMAALEMVFGSADEAEPAPDEDNAALGDEIFATNRNRKA